MDRKFTIKIGNFIMHWCTNYLGLPIMLETFENKLSNYLKDCRTVAVTEKEFHWDAICDFVRLHINELYKRENASIFCNSVIELLLAFDCPSKFFVSRIIDIYFICDYLPCFELEEKSSRLWKMNENQRLPFVLEYLKSKFTELPKINRDYSFSDQCCEDYVYTLKGIRTGNMKFMRLLVKYGCTNISPLFYNPDITLENSLDIIEEFEMYILEIAFPLGFSMVEDIHKWFTTMSWPDCVAPKPSFDRMILILKGVDAMLGQLLGTTEKNSEERNRFLLENLDCFRLYVESTSYPFLTLSEFRGFLIALSRFLRLEGAANVDKMCDAFREVYPECDAFYQPRTLKDLCRCGVRMSYGKYGSLPCTVEKLHVPTTLKDYILCQ